MIANVAADLAAAGLVVPTRQVLTHDIPVRDCEQIAVWVQRIETSFGGDTTARFTGATHRPVSHLVTWGVDVAVCASTKSAAGPTAAQVQADGETGARYGWVLVRGLTSRWVNAKVFEPHDAQLPGGKGLTVQDALPAADGGLIVVTATLALNVRDLP